MVSEGFLRLGFLLHETKQSNKIVARHDSASFERMPADVLKTWGLHPSFGHQLSEAMETANRDIGSSASLQKTEF